MNKIQKGECEMQLVNPLEQQNAVKTLYSEFVSPVCAKYGLTRIELDILLFLANNTHYDTATDIVEVRFLAKSQVSAAIKNLEARAACGGNTSWKIAKPPTCACVTPRSR